MREIKFRGLTKEGKWVKGYYVYEDLNKKHLIFDEPSFLAYFRFGALVGYVEVIPESVGQFIGLKDKNGKEIYEGDIIQDYYENINVKSIAQQVLWIEEDACFGLRPSHPYSYANIAYSDNRTVIGNIHENPELLK